LIKEARGFGSTVDEAKENAIKNLGASELDDIQFEVITIAKKKVLGLFGGNDAEVRAFIELPDEKPEKKQNNKKTAKNHDRAENKETKTAAKAEPTEGTKKNTADYGEPVDADSIPADTATGRAIAYVKTVLSNLECGEVTIKVASRENAALILLEGKDLNILIGRRGETLDALQYLASLAANNGGGHFKVSINIGNYRERREETLIALANRLAAQALKAGKCRTLEPMNPYERRIIHTAVQAIEGVESASFGEGAERRVVIAPIGVELKPRMNNGRRNNSKGNRGGRDRRNRPAAKTVSAPAREPKKDSDIPLYGKIN